MQVIDDLTAGDKASEDCVVTIGNFDGVHKGHLAVIDALEDVADTIDASTAVLTFEPHTMDVIRPEHAPLKLTSPARKLELLETTGLDYVAVLAFDTDRAKQSAEAFVEDILVDRLHARVVMIAENFRFGHGARGDFALLEKLGAEHGFRVEPFPILSGPEGAYSSTLVRQAVAEGRLAVVEDALGRPYDIRGIVIRGDERGRRLGFPTANIEPSHATAVPPHGVYAGRVRLVENDARRWRDAVVNFGIRPTFRAEGDEPRPLVEAHIFEFDADIYGRTVDVAFVHRIRGETRFESFEALRVQIRKDAAEALLHLRDNDGSGPTRRG